MSLPLFGALDVMHAAIVALLYYVATFLASGDVMSLATNPEVVDQG
jgi:hypothetical protein